MRWFKRILTGFIAVVLILSLIGLATAFSLKQAFSNPAHLKSWVQSSGFYNSLLTKASSDTAVSLGDPTLFTQISPVVTQNLKKDFPVSQFNQDVDQAINANYAWLKGKSSSPSFVIDVTRQKLAFAGDFANYAEQRYAALPKCSAAQLTNLTGVNPLTLTCQVPSISNAAVKAEVASDIVSSHIIVKNTVLTANSIKHNNKPYYSAVNFPSFYSHLNTAWIVLVVISLIAVAAICLVNRRRRKVLIVLSLCFGIAGLILLIAFGASGQVSHRLSYHLDNGSNFSSFKTPVYNFVKQATSYIGGIVTWFSLAYILIALLLIAVYYMRKGRGSKPTPPIKNSEPGSSSGSPAGSSPSKSQPGAVKQQTAPVLKRPPKKPRLIQ